MMLTRSARVAVFVAAAAMIFTATCDADPSPAPTLDLLGRAVRRWFRDGVQNLFTGPQSSDQETSASSEDLLSSGFRSVRDRVKSLIDGRLKGGLFKQLTSSNDDEESTAAESRSQDRAVDTLDSLRPSPSVEFIGRFVVNLISALQKPDSIVNIMRQKVGFVTSNLKLSCYVCEMGVGIMRQFVYANKTLDEVATTLGNVCNLLTITSDRVCHGFLNEFLPEILYVMQNIDYLDEEICGFLLGGHCIGRTYMDAFGWGVNLPQKDSMEASPIVFRRKPYANKLKVLHITDIHIDEEYVEGSIVDCGEPLCCREKKRGFGFAHHRAGKWGSTGRCDTPPHTVDSMLEYLKANHEFDYIMWTGDVPPHDIWQQSRDNNLIMTKHFNQKLKSYFPDTPIFPSVGNHESHPANSFPSPNTQGPFQIDYLYHFLNNSWNNFFQGNISDTVIRGGFYSHLVRPGLRIISLNTNYCHNKNWWMLLDSKDPAGELDWLVAELEQAERNGEKVHIIGHIPPGSVDCLYVWSENFNNIISRFQDTVAAQFYGHTHMDEFEVFYDKHDQSLPINVAYIGPSVSPYDGVNPAFKIYYIDGDYEGSPREVLDYETYYLNLDEANANDMPIWDILYSAKDAFALRSLHASEWDRLVTKMTTNNDLFVDFYR
ncbi:hypothetical protein CHUAL_012647 [Chamberlinius hualienensis]